MTGVALAMKAVEHPTRRRDDEDDTAHAALDVRGRADHELADAVPVEIAEPAGRVAEEVGARDRDEREQSGGDVEETGNRHRRWV